MKHPDCFGDIEKVFPMSDNGLRVPPESCFKCLLKTECLSTAMKGPAGLNVREEALNRAHRAGRIGFLKRWSQKKWINRQKTR